jgi:hypothetical protein
VRKPVAIGNLPVPMQQMYKNRSWWPSDPSDYMQLKEAKKKELSNNFREQLATIYEVLPVIAFYVKYN